MYSSRKIDDLRPDVAANCHLLVKRAAEKGLPVLVTDTVRDAQYQQHAFETGAAQTKLPSFHAQNAGLAFDFCKNVKGHEYDDPAFFQAVGALGKEMGYTWGGDWQGFPDQPHLQWDQGGRYSAAMVRRGELPPEMPLFSEEETMTQEQFNAMLAQYFAALAEQPPSAWSAAARDWAEEKGLFTGDETGKLRYRAFVTREELAVIMQRMAQIQGEG